VPTGLIADFLSKEEKVEARREGDEVEYVATVCRIPPFLVNPLACGAPSFRIRRESDSYSISREFPTAVLSVDFGYLQAWYNVQSKGRTRRTSLAEHFARVSNDPRAA
jgi:hypothetical protein